MAWVSIDNPIMYTSNTMLYRVANRPGTKTFVNSTWYINTQGFLKWPLTLPHKLKHIIRKLIWQHMTVI